MFKTDELLVKHRLEEIKEQIEQDHLRKNFQARVKKRNRASFQIAVKLLSLFEFRLTVNYTR
ncbi:MAG: hypothetical protein LRY73_11180 [Bacillus sp. (in: Bacteria)]|nr:hypothetical protein [Bacillus sp. (in: firmicutes)]